MRYSIITPRVKRCKCCGALRGRCKPECKALRKFFEAEPAWIAEARRQDV
jgi:hypothetical protein